MNLSHRGRRDLNLAKGSQLTTRLHRKGHSHQGWDSTHKTSAPPSTLPLWFLPQLRAPRPLTSQLWRPRLTQSSAAPPPQTPQPRALARRHSLTHSSSPTLWELDPQPDYRTLGEHGLPAPETIQDGHCFVKISLEGNTIKYTNEQVKTNLIILAERLGKATGEHDYPRPTYWLLDGVAQT